jgi:hypothetical protein
LKKCCTVRLAGIVWSTWLISNQDCAYLFSFQKPPPTSRPTAKVILYYAYFHSCYGGILIWPYHTCNLQQPTSHPTARAKVSTTRTLSTSQTTLTSCLSMCSFLTTSSKTKAQCKYDEYAARSSVSGNAITSHKNYGVILSLTCLSLMFVMMYD